MKKLIFLTGILAFLLFSCPEEPEPEIDPIDEPGVVKRDFWAQNQVNKSYYKTEAGKLADGIHCTVWVERGAGISKETAINVANVFDNNIYQKMIDNFGVLTNVSGFNYDPMDLADALTDGDGKLCILLLDIKDNYQPGVNDSAVGGYFNPEDLYDDDPNSNLMDIIYIDTYPGKPGSADSNKTLAHELQHLMNQIISDQKRVYTMDLWIDEGLSLAAEWIISGSHPQDRWGWYHTNGNGRGLINRGNNFYIWGNRLNESLYAEVDDYATAYLFFQWLRIQSNNGAGIYKEIIGSTNYNYTAITSITSTRMSINNWSDLLKAWFAANYINNTSTSGTNSIYGYKNDSVLKGLRTHYFTSSGTTPLFPGEGVFSIIDSTYITSNPNKPANTTTLIYSVLTTTPQDTMAAGALLTYNITTTNTGTITPEAGTVTGRPAPASISVVDNGRFIAAPLTLSGPFWVSGGDVFRRNGGARDTSSRLPRSSIRITANE